MNLFEIQGFWAVIMAASAGVVTFGGALSVLDHWRTRARKPLKDNAEKLKEHDDYLASDKFRIEQLEKRQAESDEESRLMLKALVTLLGHEIDGDHVDQLCAARDEIQEYLIAK